MIRLCERRDRTGGWYLSVTDTDPPQSTLEPLFFLKPLPDMDWDDDHLEALAETLLEAINTGLDKRAAERD